MLLAHLLIIPFVVQLQRLMYEHNKLCLLCCVCLKAVTSAVPHSANQHAAIPLCVSASLYVYIYVCLCPGVMLILSPQAEMKLRGAVEENSSITQEIATMKVTLMKLQTERLRVGGRAAQEVDAALAKVR